MDFHYDPITERAAAWETMQANIERRENEARMRPFRFEDLNGKPEPDKWGPKYSKPPKTDRKVSIDRFPTNCASGQKYDFDCAKYRNQMRARFAAEANADKLAWATGKLTLHRVGMRPGSIELVYKLAMAEKRARLALADMREAA